MLPLLLLFPLWGAAAQCTPQGSVRDYVVEGPAGGDWFVSGSGNPDNSHWFGVGVYGGGNMMMSAATFPVPLQPDHIIESATFSWRAYDNSGKDPSQGFFLKGQASVSPANFFTNSDLANRQYLAPSVGFKGDTSNYQWSNITGLEPVLEAWRSLPGYSCCDKSVLFLFNGSSSTRYDYTTANQAAKPKLYLR
jgi:hypothetical protein